MFEITKDIAFLGFVNKKMNKDNTLNGKDNTATTINNDKIDEDVNDDSTSNTRRLKRYMCFNKIAVMSSISFLVCSVLFYFGGQMILKQQIHNNIIIAPESNAYKFWLKPPAQILRKYFIFDVRNPLAIEKGAKPIVVQRGPYVYSEIWEKRHIEFLNDNMLSFTPIVTLRFEPDLSVGPESDTVTFINIPALGLVEQSAMFSDKFGPIVANMLFDFFGTTLFVTKTVGELIVGYEDPLMALAKQFLPNVIKDDKFSLVNGKNGTEWQNYTIMTGYDNMNDVARIISWDGKEKLDFWWNNSANLINGSDGTFFPPFRTRNDVLYAFSPDMCRSYKLTYLKDNYINNLKTYDYHLPKDMFYNTPDNQGFCEPGHCLGDGVLNISKCYGGISGFVSQPHFLNADPKFNESIDGLEANENIHDFVLHFEPNSGVPVAGNIRLQINFFMLKNENITLVKGVNPTLFPVFWFDDSIVLDADTAKQLGTVQSIADLLNILPIIFAGFGVILMLVFISIKVYFSQKLRKSTKNPSSSSTDEKTRLLDKF